jgi:hypothetical protein
MPSAVQATYPRFAPSQQHCLAFSVASVIFGGQGSTAENNGLFSAAKARSPKITGYFSAATDTAVENNFIFGGL